MTIAWGDTGRVAYGPLKTVTTTLATPRETLNGTPASLPTTEPGTSQISLTVGSGDLPTISPKQTSVVYSAFLYAGGKNTDAASQSVSWRVLKNGTSVATGTQSGVPSSQFWTHSYMQFYNASVGDVLEIRLWSSSANVNYDYYAISIIPTRVIIGKSTTINTAINYTMGNMTLSAGTPSVAVNQAFNIYPTSSGGIGVTGNTLLNSMSWDATYGTGRIIYGEINQITSTQTHATNRPYYARNAFPTQITFREILR